MLKKYKNGFLQLIQEKGLDPKLFDIEDEVSDERNNFFIRLKNSSLEFLVVNVSENNHSFFYSYTRLLRKSPSGSIDRLVDIEEVYGYFVWWLNEVQDYLDERLIPNLWEQIDLQKSFLLETKFTDSDTSNFSEEEKAQLRLSLSEFRLLIEEEFKPTEEQMRVIDERLSYVSEALDRLNRFDWRGVLLSTTIAISINLSLDTTRGKLLVDLLRRVLCNVGRLLQ